MLPYNRGPTAAYMTHINQISGRRMLQDVNRFLNEILAISCLYLKIIKKNRLKKQTRMQLFMDSGRSKLQKAGYISFFK